ncbi:MAG: hypothetical protein Q8O14_11105 [bacterium]|nr:hypothetical protein [bacterium]
MESLTNVLGLRAILDALPALVLVVDEDVRVLDNNRAATQILLGGQDSQLVGLRRAGDAMLCIHATETPAGCGHSPHCRQCVIRGSVGEAARGRIVVRRRARMELHRADVVEEICALVTATPLQYMDQARVLLVIDNISELTDIQSFLPICSVCKKIRPDEQTWLPLESYFKTYWDVDFSHSYCPACLEEERGRMLADHAAGQSSP